MGRGSSTRQEQVLWSGIIVEIVWRSMEWACNEKANAVVIALKKVLS